MFDNNPPPPPTLFFKKNPGLPLFSQKITGSLKTLTVAASPPLVERRDWVQGQLTEISHVPEERKESKSMKQEEKQNEITIKLKSTKYCPYLG